MLSEVSRMYYEISTNESTLPAFKCSTMRRSFAGCLPRRYWLRLARDFHGLRREYGCWNSKAALLISPERRVAVLRTATAWWATVVHPVPAAATPKISLSAEAQTAPMTRAAWRDLQDARSAHCETNSAARPWRWMVTRSAGRMRYSIIQH